MIKPRLEPVIRPGLVVALNGYEDRAYKVFVGSFDASEKGYGNISELRYQGIQLSHERTFWSRFTKKSLNSAIWSIDSEESLRKQYEKSYLALLDEDEFEVASSMIKNSPFSSIINGGLLYDLEASLHRNSDFFTKLREKEMLRGLAGR
jgi:hypothetical protein